MNRRNERIIELRDIGIAANLCAMAILSVIVPEKYWKSVTNALAKVIEILPGIGLRAVKDFDRLESLLPAADEKSNLGRKVAQMYFETRMQITDQHLLRKWQPKIESNGTDRIDEALKMGKGVILWITPFTYSDLVSKMGLARAGIAVNHLSRPTHGFSKSAAGIATLNKLRTKIEDRYLENRVRIKRDEQQRAMLALRRILKKNGVVSITVGAETKRPQKVPLGKGQLEIATGAIRLSQITGAPILPVFTINTRQQDYIIDIEVPLTEPNNEIADVLIRYCSILEEYIARYPAQWSGIHDFSAQ